MMPEAASSKAPSSESSDSRAARASGRSLDKRSAVRGFNLSGASRRKFTTVGRRSACPTSPGYACSVTAGALVALDHALVRNLALSDSKSTPAPLVEGTHYTLENAAGGLIRLLDVTGLTAPIKAAYDYDAANVTGLFTSTPPERFLKMVGVNTLNNAPVVVDLYRVRFDPASELALHNEEFGSFELSGSLLAVAGLMTGELGGFGTITLGDA
jgi:hypothetical protein